MEKAKDTCYKKVKAQYAVFPSARASQAIAKCRKGSGVVKKTKGGKPKSGKILSLGKLVGLAVKMNTVDLQREFLKIHLKLNKSFLLRNLQLRKERNQRLVWVNV